jgi:hypothetical protein
LASIKKPILPNQAGLFGLATFWSLFLLSGQKSLLCADTLWHIKVGQIILESGEILKQDIFSHTVAGKPWTAHEWLSEIIMAAIYNVSGFSGLSAFFFALTGFTILLLFKAAQSVSDEWSAFWAISIAAAMAQTHLLIRPHILSWLLAAFFLFTLMKQDRWLWALPILTAIWSNLHGGVLLGLVMLGAFLAGNIFDGLQERPLSYWRHHWAINKRLIIVFVLSILAIGLNPFGYSLLLFPFHVSADIFSKHISEWKAPDLKEMWYIRYWLLFVGILVAAYARKTTWAWRLLLLFFVYQAMGHIRHVSIAALLLAPWTAQAIHDIKKPISRAKKFGYDDIQLSQTSGPILLVISFVTLLSLSIIQPGWWNNFARDRFSLPESYSHGAVNYLKEYGYPGERLLNEYNWGGFLIFTLDPPPKVFIDGRADMYGQEVFSDFAKINYVHPEIDTLLNKYEIDWVLFPTGTILPRYLKSKPEWATLYKDEHVIILDRTEE